MLNKSFFNFTTGFLTFVGVSLVIMLFIGAYVSDEESPDIQTATTATTTKVR